MPWVIGKVKDKKERAGALSMLTSMVQNAVAVLSGDAEVDVHTFTGKGGDLHASLIRHCDTAIAHVLQGQNLTNEGGSTGSYAESKTSKEALTDFQEADEHLVVSFMNDLAKIYTRVNSSDAMPPVFRYREPDDYIVLADLDTKLHGVGVRFTKEHFKRKYRMTDDEFDLEAGAVEDSDSGSGDGRQAEFSSAQDKFTPDQANLELFCDDLADSASDYTQKVQNSFLKAILSADSYEDAMVKVLELYPEIDAGQLQDLLERGILNSTFYGVYTGQQETDDD
jgi:phage gp29-like protein